ncbi:TRAP transporter small permease [Deltaproteobacteria bacterium Smac51]|nr:TRAP transporter small permease [Deltaproteobacteria bacterium Smac51]
MFRKVERSVSLFAEHVGMTLIVLMNLVVCYTVFTRYVLNYTPSWGEELALLSMVWFGFLSIALGVRDDGHIGVTILDSKLSAKIIYVLDFFKWLCVFAFGLFMLIEGITLTKIGLRNNYPGLGISSAWLYIIVPISGGAMLVYCVEKVVDLLRTGPKPRATGGCE